MVTQIAAFAFIIIVIGSGIITVRQVRKLTRKVDELEKSRIEFFDVVLARIEAMAHVIEFHYPDELEREYKKIHSEQESYKQGL